MPKELPPYTQRSRSFSCMVEFSKRGFGVTLQPLGMFFSWLTGRLMGTGEWCHVQSIWLWGAPIGLVCLAGREKPISDGCHYLLFSHSFGSTPTKRVPMLWRIGAALLTLYDLLRDRAQGLQLVRLIHDIGSCIMLTLPRLRQYFWCHFAFTAGVAWRIMLKLEQKTALS